MIRNVIGKKGIYSEGNPDGTFKNVIEDLSSLPKYQILKSSPVTVSGSLQHGVIPFGTLALDGGLDVWDFDSSKLVPRKLGELYTIRLGGIIPDTGFSGNPTFHIDLEVSGIIPTGIGDQSPHNVESLNRQTHDLFLRTQGQASPDHYHYHSMFSLIATEDTIASGVQFYAATSGPEVQFISGTLFIREI